MELSNCSPPHFCTYIFICILLLTLKSLLSSCHTLFRSVKVILNSSPLLLLLITAQSKRGVLTGPAQVMWFTLAHSAYTHPVAVTQLLVSRPTRSGLDGAAAIFTSPAFVTHAASTLTFPMASTYSVRYKKWSFQYKFREGPLSHRLLKSAYRTCRCGTNNQSCCTRRIFRCIVLPRSLASRTYRILPRIFPYGCTRGRSGPGDSSRHFVKALSRRLPGTVVQCTAYGTRTAHTPEPRGRRSQRCFPHGFLCSHTDLGF